MSTTFDAAHTDQIHEQNRDLHARLKTDALSRIRLLHRRVASRRFAGRLSGEPIENPSRPRAELESIEEMRQIEQASYELALRFAGPSDPADLSGNDLLRDLLIDLVQVDVTTRFGEPDDVQLLTENVAVEMTDGLDLSQECTITVRSGDWIGYARCLLELDASGCGFAVYSVALCD